MRRICATRSLQSFPIKSYSIPYKRHYSNNIQRKQNIPILIKPEKAKYKNNLITKPPPSNIKILPIIKRNYSSSANVLKRFKHWHDDQLMQDTWIGHIISLTQAAFVFIILFLLLLYMVTPG